MQIVPISGLSFKRWLMLKRTSNVMINMIKYVKLRMVVPLKYNQLTKLDITSPKIVSINPNLYDSIK